MAPRVVLCRSGRRTARAAEGNNRRPFFAPEGDWDVPSGFAKNSDALEEVFIRAKWQDDPSEYRITIDRFRPRNHYTTPAALLLNLDQFDALNRCKSIEAAFDLLTPELRMLNVSTSRLFREVCTLGLNGDPITTKLPLPNPATSTPLNRGTRVKC